ncbi:YolD-like family protein [Brevibacillus sp. FSL K6-2834]|uniref:YolD-like family protein n=1 Tax=Brevibacillus sp. FSL K6-2834 TaxID=2954680 RepID=UPI00315849E9
MASKIDNMFAASRFVLPEQRELYLQHREEQKLEKMPVLEEDELASFQYLIRDSAREDYAITITWWQPVKEDLGKTYSMWGVIKWMDQNSRRVKLVNDEESRWIQMDAIIDVIP